MKKTLIIFISGMIFAALLGLSLKVAFKAKESALAQKIFTKLKDRKFNNAPKAEKEFMISAFTTKEDLQKWQLNHASLVLGKDKRTMELLGVATFNPGAQLSGITLQDYFSLSGAVKDWSGYQSLAFDVYNPQASRERIIAQIKDSKGDRAKIDCFLEPNGFTSVEIDIAPLRHDINIFDINNFTLFLWEHGQQKTFYIKNLRLVPYGVREKRNIFSQDLIEKPELAYATGDYFDFSKNKAKWLKADQAGGSFVEFPLFLVNEANVELKDLLFSAGIPFPRGELKNSANIEILDSQNKNLDFQARKLGLWDDGSIKWLQIDLKKDLAPNQKERLHLRYSPQINNQDKEAGLRVDDGFNQITVDTGVIKFAVNKHQFNLFEQVWLNNQLISQKNDLTLQFRGKTYSSANDKDSSVKIEELGPLKTTIKAEGWFKDEKGNKFCKYVVRIQAFAGESYVRVYHTFIYPGYPENKYHYLYQGKILPANETIQDISLHLPLLLAGNSSFTLGEDKNIVQGPWVNDTNIFQNNFNSFKVEASGKKLSSGEKMDGWLDISDQQRGMAVEIRNFWQQFPKAYILDKSKQELVISLWPKQAGELDLKTTAPAIGPDDVARGSAFGLAKTQELIFYFHNGNYQNSAVKEFAYGFMQPLMIKVSPEWISDTVALGRLGAYDSRMAPAEDTLENLFLWGKNQKERFNWYGMLDYGDTLSWYRKEAYDKSYDDWGWHPEGRWGWFNCEAVGTHTGALLAYARTGDQRYFKFGEDLARHMMDVDTCHYNTIANDKRLKRIFDDYSQVGSMHRHSADHWSGRNEETTHTNLTGILLYYYLTGYERAFDVAKEIGGFFLEERITYFRHPDIAPQRAIANMLWGDVLMYEATADEKYKKAADKWANLLYQGQHSNGAWAENYNPVEKRWDGDPDIGFMIDYTLPTLVEYHQLTRNKAIKDAIIKATQYLIKAEEYSHPFYAIAYSFWLTGDKAFYSEGARRLDHLVAHQNHGDDHTMKGMIYQKAYYLREEQFLYSAPYIFEALGYPAQTQKAQ
ncbi:MAG: hypothetical protein PHG68_03900 [Candidatus Omnitrophica bacterium]|nr:hypothetical protein [Candidatus Omnitrophota bacterium]